MIRKIVPQEAEFNKKYVSNKKLKSRRDWDGICIHCRQSTHIPEYALKKFDRKCKTCKSEEMRLKYLDDRERYKIKARIRFEKYGNGKNESYYYGNRVACYKRNDKIKQRTICDFTREELQQKLKSPCYYCNDKATGLDRIDNKKGHTKDNTVPACKDCNIARGNNFSHEEMLILGKTIQTIKNKRK